MHVKSRTDLFQNFFKVRSKNKVDCGAWNRGWEPLLGTTGLKISWNKRPNFDINEKTCLNNSLVIIYFVLKWNSKFSFFTLILIMWQKSELSSKYFWLFCWKLVSVSVFIIVLELTQLFDELSAHQDVHVVQQEGQQKPITMRWPLSYCPLKKRTG